MNKEIIENFERYKGIFKTQRPDTIKIEELDEYIRKVEQELLSLF